MLKILGIFLSIVVLALVALDIWFVSNAKEILKSIVEEKSQGKVKLDLVNAQFNFFSNRLIIKHGDLVSTDTLTVPTSYHVKFSLLTLRVRSFWPLILNNNLYLDSINIHDPAIEVLQWRTDTTTKKKEDDLSVTQEMGRLYNSMLDVLKGFGIRRIIISNASLKLVNKMDPQSTPVFINNIYLNVLRKPDENLREIKDQSVDLTTTNQNISLPDGRHQISFKKFELKLLRNRIELDSCTITAKATLNSTSSYKIFFNRLSLVGVDFAAMSKQKLIRADSVYCEYPMFDVTLNPTQVSSKKNEVPDPDKIIHDLTSDLDLAYVGVKNAGIHLNIIGQRPRSIMNSHKDNFEMRGLKINGDSSSPVNVERFDMLVRDYHLYNIDSSAIFGFDSIRFINSKILLNNFTIQTAPSRLKLKSIRDFRFPQFELSGLDWYELVFNQNVVAKEAILTNPIIRYTKLTGASQNKVNFFSTLQNMDSLMTLERLSIINGQLNLNFGKATTLDLQKVNLRVSSNKLMQATNQEGLRRAVDYFSISKGVLKRKDLTGELINVRYKPNNIINADKLIVNSATNKINAVITDVLINNMLLDDRTETIVADGLHWNNATVSLQTTPDKNSKGKELNGSFNINNISGNNTRLILTNGVTSINSSVTLLKLAALSKVDNGPVRAKGIYFAGNYLLLENNTKVLKASINEISVDDMLLQDEANNIIADGVHWKNADIDINTLQAADSIKGNDGQLAVKNLEGLNTKVHMANINGDVNSNLEVLKATSLSKNGSNPFIAEGLFIKGNNFSIKNNGLSANVQAFQVAENTKSYLQQAQVQTITGLDSMLIVSPQINFSADINSILANDYHFMSVEAIAPKINLAKWNAGSEKDSLAVATSSFRIDSLFVTQPGLYIASHRNDSLSVINIPGGDSSKIFAADVLLNDSGIHLSALNLVAQQATFTNTQGEKYGVEKGNINMNLSDLHLQKKEGKQVWAAYINDLKFDNPNGLILGKNKDTLFFKEASLGNLALSSENISDINLLFKNNPTTWVRTSTGQYSDSNSVSRWYNAVYNNQSKTLTLDSFNYHPALSLDSLVAKTPFQFDYLTFQSGAINFNNFDLDKYNQDSVFSASTINIDRPVLTVYRDRLKPAPPDELKPLPAVAISKIASPVALNKINITNGQVSYTERQEKSRVAGTLIFTNIAGYINNIKNTGYTSTDSLAVNLTASLMDKATIGFKVKQSYTDTAHGFLLNLTLDPTPLSILNPVMVPMSNVKITSGTIDSFQMSSVAKEYYAVGKMTMYYHDLHIKIVSDGNAGKSTLKNKIISFLANTLVIKNNNTNRTAFIYIDRMREKSFFNYLLKITFNGMGTSVGASKNKKNLKRFKNKLGDSGVPSKKAQKFITESL